MPTFCKPNNLRENVIFANISGFGYLLIQRRKREHRQVLQFYSLAARTDSDNPCKRFGDISDTMSSLILIQTA